MRIQILPLPSVVVGDDVEEPFALIVDQHDADMDETTAEAWQQFKTSAGARALLITPDTVEVVDRYAETPPQEPATKGDTAMDGLLPPNTVVLADRNGNPMNMRVTCSCGSEMTRDWSANDYAPGEPSKERTAISCRTCGNRLTVTAALGGGAVQDMPHAYEADDNGCCTTCGLGRLARVHRERI